MLQGDPLSTILFKMVLEKTTRSSKLNRDGDIMHKSHQIIRYADDLAVIARSEEGLKNITQRGERRGGMAAGIAGE